jgi:hypothetical protein
MRVSHTLLTKSLVPSYDGLGSDNIAGAAPPPFYKAAFYLETMLNVKNTGYTTIMLCYDRHQHLLELAEALDKAGMLTNNGEYLYIVIQDAAPPHEINSVYQYTSPSSSLGKLLHGAIVLSALDGYTWNPQQDKLLTAWRSQGHELANVANAKSPGYNNNDNNQTEDSAVPSSSSLPSYPPLSSSSSQIDSKERNFKYFQADGATYFQSSIPYVGSSFVYDSVMAIGFGTCLQEARETLGVGPPPKRRPPPRPGFESDGPENESSLAADEKNDNSTTVVVSKPPDDPNLVFGLPPYRLNNHQRDYLTPFVGAITDIDIPFGASGKIQFSTDRKYRSRETLVMGAYSIRYNPDSLEWEAVLASIRGSDLTWNETSSYVYNAGSTEPPSTTLKIQEENYLTTWVRAFGFFLLCIAWLVGLVCILSVYVLRETIAIRTAQPFFLILVCVGSMTTSATIFTLSFDEGQGWDNDALSRARTLSPWLFFLGHTKWPELPSN